MSETNKRKVSCGEELKRGTELQILLNWFAEIYVSAVCYPRKVIAKFVSQEALSVEGTQIGNDSRSTLRLEKSSRLGNIDLTADKRTSGRICRGPYIFVLSSRLSLLRHDRRD